MRKDTLIPVFALLLSASLAAQNATYTNPAAGGDFPDPSVIRVGQDFWATATSSEWGPPFPLLHSRDLVNWRIAGTVFPERPAWAAGNFWAPEIAADKGRYFVFYTARKKDGPLCVAVARAQAPQGPYKDYGPLVCQELGSIDGMPIRDENGELWLVWKEDGNSQNKPTPLWAQRLTEDGTKLTGERIELVRNTEPWEAPLVEGPFLLRRGNWFYLFYSGNACCGRECNYALGVARSRKLVGPWEKNPKNPILKGNEHWKCPGHGSIVDDGRGRIWLLYHAYNAQDSVYVGRQALLDEVVWGADGWPTINNGKGPSREAASPFGKPELNPELRFSEEFDANRLAPGWQWPQGRPAKFRLDSKHGGRITLEGPGVLARFTATGSYTATAKVDISGLRDGAASLAAYGDEENIISLTVGNGRVRLVRREKGKDRELASAQRTPAATIYLRMTAEEGHLFRFAFSADGKQWRNMLGDEVDGAYLPPWDRGIRVALTVSGNENSATFDSLTIEPAK